MQSLLYANRALVIGRKEGEEGKEEGRGEMRKKKKEKKCIFTYFLFSVT